MPELCRFFGIIIRMYCNDHEPAHFHAINNEHEALIGIASLEILRGHLPKEPWQWFWNGPSTTARS